MGCDITVHFEIKINNEWHHYSSPYIERNYKMFGWLAGVREPQYQQIQVKGISDDLSVVTLENYKHTLGYSHNHSWLTAKEISNWIATFPKQLGVDRYNKVFHPPIGYLFNNGYEGFSFNSSSYPPYIKDLRMVFWFNN